jgi:CRISPR-associated endonuclease Csn1
VSHRPDHGTISKAGAAKGKDQTAGRLHNETAYGITGEKDAKGNTLVVHRVPLNSLKKPSDIDDVRDPVLRKELQNFTQGLEGKVFEEKLHSFPKLGHLSYRNIRRLRVIEPLDVIPIRDKEGRIYKGYKGDSNYRYDVWELKDGKWTPEVVSMFSVHQPGWSSKVRAENPAARKVLSLHQGDIIAIEPSEGDRKLLRVVKYAQSGAITFAPPNEGGNLKARDTAADDPFKYVYLSASSLKANKARQVRVDELGRVADPGFPARKVRRRTRKPLAAE